MTTFQIIFRSYLFCMSRGQVYTTSPHQFYIVSLGSWGVGGGGGLKVLFSICLSKNANGPHISITRIA